MIDRELYEAEELDFYVESHHAGQAAQPNPSPGECSLAEKLLGISAVVQPDVHFLINLENQIHETARKPDETIVFKNNNMQTNEQSELSTERKALFSQPKKIRLFWLPLVVSITVILLRMFLATS